VGYVHEESGSTARHGTGWIQDLRTLRERKQAILGPWYEGLYGD